MNRLRSECMSCLVKNISDIPEQVSEPDRISYMQQVFRILADAPLSASAPEIVCEINRLKRERLGIENEFAELKQHFNEFVMRCKVPIRKKIHSAADPLLTAIQYALVGNYIDFGAMDHVDEQYLLDFLSTASNIQLDSAAYAHLQNELAKAKHLLFLTDNCGEIVLDKLLIEVLKTQYPALSITVMVRGEPVLNDATMEDAHQVGLNRITPVIDNGNGIAGTCLDELSPQGRDAVDKADLILSKGQGNFETLRGCGKNVFYLFLCKCDLFARVFQVPKLTGMLVHDRHCTDL